MKVTVLGSTGGLGRAITRELVTRGHEVVAASRRGDAGIVGARPAPVDLEAPDTTTQIMSAATGSDVIVMAAQPPYDDWDGRFDSMLTSVIDASADLGSRLVLVDNLYAYGMVDGPINESTPERPPNAKCRLRQEIGQRLLAAHESGKVRVSIGRCSDYHGPEGVNSLLLMMGISRLVAGKSSAQAIFDADQPHSWHFLPDMGRAFATLTEDPRADGRVWVFPAAEPRTQRQMYELAADILGQPVKVRTLSRRMMRLASPFLMEARESLHVAEQFERPWVVDGSAFDETFGPLEPTPHRDALARTIAWAQQHAQTPVAA